MIVALRRLSADFLKKYKLTNMFFPNFRIKLRLNGKGFTLVEILVAVVIVVIIIGAAIGVFASVSRSKQKIALLKEVEDNARYAMECMSRDIRMASELGAGESMTCDSELDFAGDKRYLLQNDTIKIRRVPPDYEPLTSSEVKVTDLQFCVFDKNADGDDIHPSVTILMAVESAKDSSIKLRIQTTVSTKIY
jgi:prepilin-type N-terminal cleavage/methylation domain-containing protein